ncbi:hypothetical protein BCR37DRAFT_168242 [Protomyces lactucae-debilis]|uniref:Uncharacterized protein n=1 Tax=Protomyces lactucae-debilis TaxID=2754530 RepID=A0A1Y2EWX8_PROLT|nr:uncharacterized protein BCR37DRAFT_168242 [Protomyces lactucae-debilis]ORY76068.1 hypothetical protein BCR37DRAFT_168242 [Protomyces lactucae-debilis]
MSDPFASPWTYQLDGRSTASIPVKTLPAVTRSTRQRSKAGSNAATASITRPVQGAVVGGSKMGGRPRSITLPGPYRMQQSSSPLSSPIFALPTPGLSWTNTSLDGRLLSPAESGPTQQFSARDREGSILSSGSSSDGRVVAARPILQPRSQSARSTTTLASMTGRPGLTPASRARGLSLSLVVGAEGQAALHTEARAMMEEDPGMRGEAMRRMASFAGSDVSVTRPLGGLTLATGGRSETLMRSVSQHAEYSPTMPLTPLTAGYDQKYISPSQMRRPSLMQTPESIWDSPESNTDETHSPFSSLEESLPQREDARAALQQVYDRRRGGTQMPLSTSLPAPSDFFVNMMPTSPQAPLQRARHRHPLTCGACHMVFRTARAHQVHTSGGCGVKQAPFLASDFLEALDAGSSGGFFDFAHATAGSSPPGVQDFQEEARFSGGSRTHGSLLASPLLSGDEELFSTPVAASSEPKKRSLVGGVVLPQQESPSQIRTSKRAR